MRRNLKLQSCERVGREANVYSSPFLKYLFKKLNELSFVKRKLPDRGSHYLRESEVRGLVFLNYIKLVVDPVWSCSPNNVKSSVRLLAKSVSVSTFSLLERK